MLIDIQIEGDKNGLIEVKVYRQLTPTGKPSSRLTGYIKHSGLNVALEMVDSDLSILQARLTNQARKWTEEWNIIEKNREEISKFGKIKSILDGIQKDIVIDWERVRDQALFPKEKPIFKELEPKLRDIPLTPKFFDLFNLFIKSRRDKLFEEQKQSYEKALELWKEKEKLYEDETKEWEKEKKEFEKRQEEYNKNVETLRVDYEKSKPQAIEWYSQILLEQSSYPVDFKKKIAIEYKANERLLVVEYFLPSTDNLPKIKETKYLKSTGEMKEVSFSDREFNALYEDTLYRITLRTVYELFKADAIDAIDHIVFNGWVNNLNKAIGKRQDMCILSLMVSKTEFMDVNLIDVDAKACFKRFKGVSASELSELTPIPPILKISREDRRFVEEQEVGKNLGDSANVAAMDWQDFEHLIREIFEREYSSIGGEVKVTQSSRDKGVDAIAFDPDPIRGGKVIIQAKRYTNTVHIESVRALYGIMQDEGAMKGILVTTSDFGSDSYSFVKDKPITLLNGGNLLSMLHKHGYSGKIDLDEAKKLLDGYND